MINRRTIIYKGKLADIVISFIAVILIGVFIYGGYKSVNISEKRFALEHDVKNAMAIIETAIEDAEEIKVDNNIYNIDNYLAEELFTFKENDQDVMYLIVKVNSEREELWEVSLCSNSNYSMADRLNYINKRVLIDDIKHENKYVNGMEVNPEQWIENIEFIGLT